MRARVDAALTLDVREVPPKVVERLCRMLSFPNPAFLDRLRLGLNPGASSRRCASSSSAGELRPLRDAIHVLPSRGRAGHGSSSRATTCVLPDATLVPALGLRDYQSAADEKLATVTQGTVVILCGGGKTRAGWGAIARLRTPTLILVHTSTSPSSGSAS